MNSLSGVFILLLSMNYLAGCALVNNVTSGNFKYNPSHSYAWNISVASKQEPSNERKVSAEDLKLSGNKRYYWGAPEDISPYNLSNLDLWTLIASYPAPSFQTYDWQTSGLMAWMPLELAADRKSALRVYSDTLSKATKKAFSNVVIDSPVQILEKGYSSLISEFFKGSHIGKTVWVHPNFTDEELGCVNEYSAKMHRPDCGFFLQQDGAMGIYETPSFLAENGGKKSYLFSGLMGGSVMNVGAYSRGDVISSHIL